jgi:hypothetical protein
MTIPWWDQKHRVVFKKHEKIEKVTSSQDDDSVVGIKNIGSSAKNTKDRKSHKLSGKALHSASLRFHGRPGQAG